MRRTLHLTNPHMKGQDVKDCQWLLNQHHHANLNVDGDFGIATATECKEWKWDFGYPSDKCTPSFGQFAYDLLTGTVAQPADYAKRAKDRAESADTVSAKRKKAVDYGLWGIANEPQIHYAMVRPMDRLNDLLSLPAWNDCSEFVTKAYKYGGLPDPNGNNYDGYGNTDTLLQHMKQISKESIRLADLVVWGNLPNSHHVAMVIGLASDPILVSHGREGGPNRIAFSVENRWQAYRPVHWLTLP